MLKQSQIRKIKTILGFIFMLATAVATPLVFALDNASQESLGKTQHLLNDQTERQAAIQGNDKAMKVDEAVKALANGDTQLTGEVYSLASEVLENVMKDSNGDPEKMQQALERFSKNPESFTAKWTPAQKAKLKELADKLGAASVHKK